ncbi:MAG TPA: hypothetical protein DEH78_16690, partial [Solibacterales bacterium]|nr:hypothetical protein [Bryobacterales bacterium]
MSNFLGIAAVTATLTQLVGEAAATAVTGAGTRNARPDSIPTGEMNDAFVNVFLYQVNPNAAMRNMELPTRDSSGALVQRPFLALDLGYLISFYGNESDLVPQRLMGAVLRRLHSEPILGRQRIRDTVASIAFLASSNLADDIESVRLANLGLTLEEIFKLWSAFHQSPYVLSTAFQASVVLLEGLGSPRAALPVRSRTANVLPFRYPEILSIDPPVFPFVPGAQLTLLGRNLDSPAASVMFRELEGTIVEPLTAERARVQLPAGIRAGVNTVKLHHDLLIGLPPVRHKGVESNAAAFMLQPRLVARSFTPAPEPSIEVTLDPPVGRDQEAHLLLNQTAIPPGQAPLMFTFSLTGRAAPAA